jgi:sporulation protein YlmC with PRC-barrel domain
MRSKLLIGGLLASVMIVPALAQSNPPASSTNTPSATSTTTAPASTTSQSNMWRASKVVGLNVYNDQNEKLGDISEILLDKSGKVEGVVIGVGGFLGLGQHDIKVEMSKLRFVDEPVRTSANSNSGGSSSSSGSSGANTTTGAANRPANATAGNSTSSRSKWYPDHAVLSGVTKDQLKGMPQFKFD